MHNNAAAEAGGSVAITVETDAGAGLPESAVEAADVGPPRRDEGGERFAADETEEKVCRICHLSAELGGPEHGSELIQLGCGCKGELGAAHRRCAEAWFRVKGDRCCEICGVNAKNIAGEVDHNFIQGWNSNDSSSEGACCLRSQPFCNFLFLCLVFVFILPLFFHVKLI